MPITSFTVAGVEVNPLLDTFEIRETVGGVSTLACDVASFGSPPDRFAVHDVVVVQEDAVTIFAGIVMQARERGLGAPNLYTPTGDSPEIVTTITAEDYSRLAERIHVTEIVADGTLLKAFLTTLVSTYFGPAFGVTLHASQVDGPALPAMTFDLARGSDVLKALADATQFVWRIDYDKQLRMWSQGDLAAPFNINETDDPAKWSGDVEVENILGDDYANRIIVISAPVEQQGRIESFTGDGVTSTFQLSFTLTKSFGIIHIYESDGVTPAGGETFATVGTDTATQWEHDPVTNTITRVIGPTESGKIYRLTFDGTFTARAEAEDAGHIAANGLYEDVVRAENITDNDAALALAQALLAERLNAGEQRIGYETRVMEPTFHVGQLQTITAPSRDASGDYIITELSIRAEVPVTTVYAASGLGLIRRVSGKQDHALAGRWQDTYRDWLRIGGGGAGVEVGEAGAGQSGPAPPNRSVQFNNEGVFGGRAACTYHKDFSTLMVGIGHTPAGSSNFLNGFGHTIV